MEDESQDVGTKNQQNDNFDNTNAGFALVILSGDRDCELVF